MYIFDKQDAGDSPDAPQPREMIDMEATFEKLEHELQEVKVNFNLEQGSQTQIYVRTTFQRKNASQAAVYQKKSSFGPQFTRKVVKNKLNLIKIYNIVSF